MWYFTWILGLGFALAFGVINAIWFELLELQRGTEPPASAPVDRKGK
ncbi:MAG TPA: cytochrome bd-I oxidase subunit CydX [Steroidobacteraceae bacterium]|nr:cytochrome bd-I oxidase subunit CydX [Steroidobacteraceae bacterium]